jgi:hypothetical protein
MKKTIMALIALLIVIPSIGYSGNAYVAADLGSSFSPNGFGIAAGYAPSSRLAIDLGTGYSKNNLLGTPISLGCHYGFIDLPHGDFGDASIGVRAGLTYYSGVGNRTVIHFGDSAGFEDRIKWEMLYAQVGMELSRRISPELSLVMGVGFGRNEYSKIKLTDTYGDTNLGPPLGIDVDKIPGTYAGIGDVGIYLNLTARWMI